MPKLESLSIFFPFYNDEKTVAKQIRDAYQFGLQVTSDLEVIAIHGGNSKDKTYQKILEQKRLYPDLRIIDKSDNKEGYAVIKYGFKAAKKDWVFYTDGDSQYRLNELKKLVEKQTQTIADVVNGYKLKRHDSFIRKTIGSVYNLILHKLYPIPISDLDCDFRLMKKSYLNKIRLSSKSGAICLELILKLQNVGATFAEVGVHHYPRAYGKSEFFNFSSIFKSLLENIIFFLQQRPLLKDRKGN